MLDPANSDPTFQSVGELKVTFRNMIWGSTSVDSDGVLSAPKVSPIPPTYGPPNDPPPAWTRGKQWNGWAHVAPTAGFASPETHSKGLWTAGAMPFVFVYDMSKNGVIEGKQYVFTADVWRSIRLYWLIAGVVGGSTVLPGFSLYNLKDYPETWHHITPLQFTGTWEVELLHPDFVEITKLRVEYGPYRSYQQARLNFSIESARWMSPWEVGGADENGPPAEAALLGKSAVLELLTPESEFRLDGGATSERGPRSA